MMAKTPAPAKQTKNAKSSATTRSTAGPGFVFEDQIAAFLSVKMLTGEPIPGLGDAALASTVRSQTESLGWLIDDLLAISAVSGAQIALSCKSNRQVTGNGLPDDFVLDAWQQWSNRSPENPFSRDDDKLMLVTRGSHHVFEPLWADIKNWCSQPDNPLAVARIRQTAAHAKILDKAKSAILTVEDSVSDEDVAGLFAKLEIFPTDFHLPNSQSRDNAIAQCRRLLVTGAQAEAVDLWDALVSEAETARTTHGMIKLETLWSQLAQRFKLKSHPNYEHAWKALDAITADVTSEISTGLPTGLTIDRAADADTFATLFSGKELLVLFGESGSGKSALVKATLTARFPDWRQVWLRPDDLATALSAAKRQSAGLDYPLEEVLKFSSTAKNVLVFDAAERLPDEVIGRANALVASLIAHNGAGASKWHIVVVGQSDSWSQGRLQRIGSTALPEYWELKLLAQDDVQQALLSSPQLRWAASHSEIVYALTNPRTLAWVLEAAPRFAQNNVSSLASHIAIADHLWQYWTEGKETLQRTLVDLAVREANFEHSFEISKLESGHAEAVEKRPPQLPLRKNKYNRFEFQHDLASDWIRFQRLKEVATDTSQWTGYAGNPLWLAALRMLGGFLLRDHPRGGRSSWDVAFEAVASQPESTTAADLLLDALCLDPEAEVFLRERTDLLLRENGKLLHRLLRRFQHVATVPGGPSKLLGDVMFADPSFGLYLEAQFRTPIALRWVAIARFLHTHQDRIASLCSPTVASTCSRWLSAFPPTFDGSPFPLRREFAELALATARAVQLQQAKGTIFADDWVKDIYAAALAAAPDLPDEVAQWALEMAKRRPLDATLASQVAEHRRQKDIDHEQRLKTDEAYRSEHERRRRASGPSYIPSGRKLPPWPLGPHGRIDHHFREACATGAALLPLMKARPAEAAELLLALLIEGNPEESYSRTRFRDDVGLAHDRTAYPTGFWKSPFFSFLMIDPIGLETLLKLVDFCTERWAHEVRRSSDGIVPIISLSLEDGAKRDYLGARRVFEWCLASTSSAGQLNSALAALERWLAGKIEAGEDVRSLVRTILVGTNSVGVLGVLVNIGKLKPDMFLGPLKPITANTHLYRWDEAITAALGDYFDGMQLSTQGDIVFNLARDWHFAPHHTVTMLSVVSDLANADPAFADYLRSAIAIWPAPDDEKAAIEQRIRAAQLDSANYEAEVDAESGVTKYELRYPPSLVAEVRAFQTGHVYAAQILLLPNQCLKVLNQPKQLEANEAKALAALLDDTASEAGLEDEFKERAKIAVACTLSARAIDWLQNNEGKNAEVQRIIDDVLAAIGDGAESLRGTAFTTKDHLSFIAYAVFEKWLRNPGKESDAAVLKLMTSGDRAAQAVLFGLGHRHHEQLAERWQRLLKIAVLWAGLSILRPRFDEETVGWNSWLKRFRTWPLSDASLAIADASPVSVAKRIERLERSRWRREYNGKRQIIYSHIPPEQRRSDGLDWSLLESAFAWLTSSTQPASAGDLSEDERLLLSLWSYEVWRRHQPKGDREDESAPNQLGYRLLEELAKKSLTAPAQDAHQFWQPVLALGAPAHYSVGHFLSCWFTLASTADPNVFAVRWRQMIQYALAAPTWGDGNPWYYGQRLLAQVLGCSAARKLDTNPIYQTVVAGFKDLFEAWANDHLRRDDSNVVALCSFLASSTGKALRLSGLTWVHSALTGDDPVYITWRSSALTALTDLLDVSLAEDLSALSADPGARSTFLALVDLLVARQANAALALQERARRLLRPDR